MSCHKGHAEHRSFYSEYLVKKLSFFVPVVFLSALRDYTLALRSEQPWR